VIEAVLHGKLTREEEGMEDLLTSNTFGLMKYLPPKAVLIPFLSLARNFENQKLSGLLGDAIEVEHLHFWPFLAHPDCIGCEPDVDLLFRGKHGKRTWILIEAKYRSGKSSAASEEDERPNDQLAREFDNLKKLSQKKKISRYALVYLTTDYTCPRVELKESINEYKKKRGLRPDIYWLSWRMLFDALETVNIHEDQIVKDLTALLTRLNLTMFRRLRISGLRKVKWGFERILKRWYWKALKPKWSFARREIAWTWRPFQEHERWHFQNLSTERITDE
jgi:hypothetical protein